MTIEKIMDEAWKFLEGPENFVAAEEALQPEIAGMRIYDEPLFGVASADDPLFLALRRPGVVHPGEMTPRDWVPGAKSVVAFFLPFSQRVINSNSDAKNTSDEWLHGRIEGQIAMEALGERLKKLLEDEGCAAAFPTTDARFKMLEPYASNWSERHVAYICGLGTFGLSKGLITERGMAGRFGSIVTDAELAPTPRRYSEPFEYCTKCGACQFRCPAKAIDKSRGYALAKDQKLCDAWVTSTKRPPHGPHSRVRFGCGKCQTRVPCSRGIPKGARSA